MSDGAFPNPLIAGFNPDPSCILVDGVYYAVTSSFEYLPGLPIYRSEDFVTWEHVGNVATREEQVGVAEVPSGAGVWAPTIRYHDGLFYVIVAVAISPRGCVVFTAEDPAGTWSDGMTIDGIVGIDPDLAWDETGAPYVTYSGLDLRTVPFTHHGILQVRVDLETGACLEEPRSLWSGTGLVAPEAPHLYRRGESWYLLIAEGGTGYGHAVSVARGPSIEGPFEGAPNNPILSAAGRGGPVNCTGHADLVRGPDGTDLLVLLATRLVGSASPLGRETFVTHVEWLDGWPQPAPVDLNPRTQSLEEHFDFADTSAMTDPGWLAVRRAPGDVGDLSERPGYLSIRADSGGLGASRPDFLGRRQRHLTSVFETRIDASEGKGGLALRYDEDFTVVLIAERASSAGGTRVTARASMPTIAQSWSTELASDEVVLRIATGASPPAKAPWSSRGDGIRLIAADDAGGETQLAEVDGRFWSVETSAPFTGRVTGVFAEAGVVRFAHFRYHGEGGS